MATQAPFLTTHMDGSKAYLATAPGDLGKFFEAIWRSPELVYEVKSLTLTKTFDGQSDSGLLDFVLQHGTKADIIPTSDEDYESCPDDWEDDAQEAIAVEEGIQARDSTATQDGVHIQMAAFSVTMDGPVDCNRAPPVTLELSESVSAVAEMDDTNEETVSVASTTFAPDPPDDVLQTAMDDFMALAALTDMEGVIPEQFYLKLMRAMLSVCCNVDTVELPDDWRKIVEGNVFPNLKLFVVHRDGGDWEMYSER